MERFDDNTARSSQPRQPMAQISQIYSISPQLDRRQFSPRPNNLRDPYRPPRQTLIRARSALVLKGTAPVINLVWTHPIIGGAATAICDAARDDAAVPW